MPERAIAIDSAEFESGGGMRALLRRALGRNPIDAIGLFVLLIAAGAILINALYRQPGPHPAPIFSIKPRPVASEPVGGVVPAMPRARPEPHRPDETRSGRAHRAPISSPTSSASFAPRPL